MDLEVVKTTPVLEPQAQLNIGASFTLRNPEGGKAFGHVLLGYDFRLEPEVLDHGDEAVALLRWRRADPAAEHVVHRHAHRAGRMRRRRRRDLDHRRGDPRAQPRAGLGSVYTDGNHQAGTLGDIGKVLIMHALDVSPDVVSTKRIRAIDPRAHLRTATRLKHPHIVGFYDFFVDDEGTAYMVMEYIDGINVRDMIRNCGALPVSPALADYATF